MITCRERYRGGCVADEFAIDVDLGVWNGTGDLNAPGLGLRRRLLLGQKSLHNIQDVLRAQRETESRTPAFTTLTVFIPMTSP